MDDIELGSETVEQVELRTSDGLTLHGSYVPSQNGAAVIVAFGRKGTQRPARMLVRHGYGVLIFDRRGEGESDGDPNPYAWNEGELDLLAAIDFLERRPEVEPGRIGGLGLSVGGETFLQTAARSEDVRAVVSEGASARSVGELVSVPGSPPVPVAINTGITAGTAVFSDAAPPPHLIDLVGRDRAPSRSPHPRARCGRWRGAPVQHRVLPRGGRAEGDLGGPRRRPRRCPGGTPARVRAPRHPLLRPSPRKGPAMTVPRFSPRELAFMIGVPIAWGILLLFHPLGDGSDFYSVIDGNVTAWLTVHIGMGIFVPLFAGVVYLLLRGIESRAATISRIGLAVFAVIYAAWELLLGVGTGILTDEVNALPKAQQAVGVDVLESYADSGLIAVFSVIGSVGLGVAMIGAVVALRGAYRVGWPALVLMLLSVPLIAVHEPPFGPVGLAVFIVSLILIVRRRATAPAARSDPSLDQPVSA